MLICSCEVHSSVLLVSCIYVPTHHAAPARGTVRAQMHLIHCFGPPMRHFPLPPKRAAHARMLRIDWPRAARSRRTCATGPPPARGSTGPQCHPNLEPHLAGVCGPKPPRRRPDRVASPHVCEMTSVSGRCMALVPDGVPGCSRPCGRLARLHLHFIFSFLFYFFGLCERVGVYQE